MKGIKLLVISAASGFILSFLFGLFSHTSIISILLKAILFAVVFGILGFLINLAVYKFLIDESQDSKELSGMNSDGNVIYSGNESKTGQMVDITIQDEELEKGESDNHFVVGDAHTMLKDSDVEKSGFSEQTEKPKIQKETEKNGFVPLTNFENVKTESDSESENYDEPENNSDYVPLGNKKSESSHEVKDAALIAKAISSVLSGENSE